MTGIDRIHLSAALCIAVALTSCDGSTLATDAGVETADSTTRMDHYVQDVGGPAHAETSSSTLPLRFEDAAFSCTPVGGPCSRDGGNTCCSGYCSSTSHLCVTIGK
jgi:hypothetical protein